MLENANTMDNKNLNSNKEMIKLNEVKNTPFSILEKLENEEYEYYVMLGKYRLSESFKSLEEAMEDAKRTDWERLMQVVGVMVEEFNNKSIIN